VPTRRRWRRGWAPARHAARFVAIDRLRYLADVLPPECRSALLQPPQPASSSSSRCRPWSSARCLLPGAKAPKLVRRDRSQAHEARLGDLWMSPVDQGGCIETIKPRRTRIRVRGVMGIITMAVANIAGRVLSAHLDARAHERNLPLRQAPGPARLRSRPAQDDPALFLGLNVVEGRWCIPPVAETFGLPSAIQDPRVKERRPHASDPCLMLLLLASASAVQAQVRNAELGTVSPYGGLHGLP